MARPIPDMDQMTAAEVATDDSIIIDDTSAGETKRINVGDLVGLPLVGWTAAGEVHTYSAWDSTRRMAEITVPSDATIKYQAGNRYRFTQATGGTKFGLIMRVTTTKLFVLMPTGTTFNNETITNPYYSPLDTPIGFNKDETLWQFQATLTVTATVSAVAGQIANPGGLSLALGVGTWDVEHQGAWAGGTTGSNDIYTGLSTGASTRSDSEMEERHFQAGSIWSSMKRKTYTHTSNTTYYATISPSTTTVNVSIRGEVPQITYGAERNIIRAKPALL